MPQIESSIIIPVYNKWDLTRNCLKSIAATTDKDRVEVIVVDNASSDVTPNACAFLGKELFRENFKFIRNEINRNFAGASNQGAKAARGEYLIFLNNDTATEPGWYEPLINDFSVYPDIAATGPLLLYPDKGPFGRLVQHMGVLVTPYFQFGHLYQGIPEASVLTRKRRFFQVITAACMVIRKSLFLDIGEFDEEYKNGFEDVDLCGRLTAAGWRFTVNPEAKVAHYEGQSPGRGKNESENYKRLRATNIKYFKPDWHSLLKNDGFNLKVNEWVFLQPALNGSLKEWLNTRLQRMESEEVHQTLIDNLYWEEGWEKYLSFLTDPEEQIKAFKIYFKLFRNIPNAAKSIDLGRRYNDSFLLGMGKSLLKTGSKSCGALLEDASIGKQWCITHNLPEIAAEYDEWIKNYDNFRENVYPYYMKNYMSLINN